VDRLDLGPGPYRRKRTLMLLENVCDICFRLLLLLQHTHLVLTPPFVLPILSSLAIQHRPSVSGENIVRLCPGRRTDGEMI
jgi:hypothetical protein